MRLRETKLGLSEMLDLEPKTESKRARNEQKTKTTAWLEQTVRGSRFFTTAWLRAAQLRVSRELASQPVKRRRNMGRMGLIAFFFSFLRRS